MTTFTGSFRLPGETVTTSFWMDFGIAEHYGRDAILDTYERAFEEWKQDYRYLTNLVVVLNHKAWQYEDINPEYAELYCELYEKANAYACSNLKGTELQYFFDITD